MTARPAPPPDGTPRLFLLDGYALIYRAFFALLTRPLRTARGENTSAAWGVANFLLRLRATHRPDYVAWVNDAGDSFRTQAYAEYKSTREKLDAELQADFDTAVERVAQLLAAFRIPLVAVDGYEADDVIGTLATRAAGAGLQAVIVSGDKDFYQLIGPRVALLNPGRGGPAAVEETWVDEANASERLGVPPGQVIDFLALVGDSSDNVPGVKGVGEKGAQKLLADYGDLETILAKAPEVPQKRTREALLAHAAEARLSRQLVTIRTDVPVAVELDALRAAEPDTTALGKLFAELEFASLAARLGAADGGAGRAAGGRADERTGGMGREAGAEELAEDGSPVRPSAGPPVRPATMAPAVELVTSASALGAIVASCRAAPLVALDTETSSLQPHDAELIGLSLATSPDEVWYLSFGHRPRDGALAAPDAVHNLPPLASEACAPLRALLEDPAVPKAGHNLKYDWQVLRRAGVELRGAAYDSMLASFVLDPGRRSHAIDTLALEAFGETMTQYTDLAGKGKAQIPFAEVAQEAAAAYCGADSAMVLRLHAHFAPALGDATAAALLRDLELPLVRVLVDMEWAGIRIDRALFAQLALELADDLRTLEQRIGAEAGTTINLNSPKQLAQVLFEQQGLPVLKKTKTGPSTDADVLEQLAAMGNRLPQLILDYRELQKLKSTYVDTLPQAVHRETGRIHTSFSQVGAATGRLSSSDPNLQNIPVRTPRGEAIRRGFVPEAGCVFLVADYSQIELRLMAHLSEDAAFVEAFRAGGDIHRQTAALVFGVDAAAVTPEQRARAKTINFGIIYGQGPFALAKSLGITQDEAKQFIAQYFERFSGVRRFLDACVAQAREHGWVETIVGRRRYIPEIRDRNFNTRAFGERVATNSPLQGSAADLIKRAMIDIHHELGVRGLGSRMLLQVHDELVFEVPVAEEAAMRALVRERMEGAAVLRVPLVVDIGVGPTWLDAKK
ncbi:MAG: DNA polymerase I [Gemmatimonadales bacterium]|nr:DNA polymerase I [Gemmatimonadales bacterium]